MINIHMATSGSGFLGVRLYTGSTDPQASTPTLKVLSVCKFCAYNIMIEEFSLSLSLFL